MKYESAGTISTEENTKVRAERPTTNVQPENHFMPFQRRHLQPGPGPEPLAPKLLKLGLTRQARRA